MIYCDTKAKALAEIDAARERISKYEEVHGFCPSLEQAKATLLLSELYLEDRGCLGYNKAFYELHTPEECRKSHDMRGFGCMSPPKPLNE